MMIAWMWMAAAWSGDGPWTLQPRETNVYVGLDYYSYSGFRNGDGTLVDLGSALSATGATLVVTRGLARGVEAELRLPYERVRANDPESDFCLNGPRADWCEATGGIGDIVAVAKFRLIDEADLNPLSASVSLAFRTGELYSERRGRLTTLGDGQSDLGLIVSAGRTASAGAAGWYQVSGSAFYWYRFPHAAGEPKIPADEIGGQLDVLYAPTGQFAVGPTANVFYKLDGVNVTEAALDTLNGLASIQGGQAKVGGKVGIYGKDGLTLTASALFAVWAHNNPHDTLSISFGLGWFIPAPDRPPRDG